MHLEIPNGQKPYLHHVSRLRTQIECSKLGWQISTIEGIIETILYKLILGQTGEQYIAVSHCNDLLSECLIKRCVIISQTNN